MGNCLSAEYQVTISLVNSTSIQMSDSKSQAEEICHGEPFLSQTLIACLILSTGDFLIPFLLFQSPKSLVHWHGRAWKVVEGHGRACLSLEWSPLKGCQASVVVFFDDGQDVSAGRLSSAINGSSALGRAPPRLKFTSAAFTPRVLARNCLSYGPLHHSHPPTPHPALFIKVSMGGGCHQHSPTGMTGFSC